MSLFLRLFAIICVAVGLLHLSLGLHADNLLGADLGLEVISNATLDSQNRFYGAAFMLFGVVSWICVGDLKQNAQLFRMMMLLFFIGGVARLISAINYGMPAPLVQFLAISELLIPPFLLWWHSAWLRKQAASDESHIQKAQP